MECRVCKGTNITSVLDLGKIYPSNFVQETTGEKEPLELVVCETCGLVQLRDTVELDKMYRQYWYKSGLNKTMVKALQEIADSILELGYSEGRFLDIGANDGTLASLMPDTFYKVGIDPALNLRDEAVKYFDEFVNDYFPSEEITGKFDVITSIAMFYDLPDPVAFIESIKKHLKDSGVWIVQFTDLKSMLQLNAFDNICAEHLEYYSLNYLKEQFSKRGLQIFDVCYNDVNGGSVRIYVDKGSRPVHENVWYALLDELTYFKSFENPFQAFRERVLEAKNKLMRFLEYNQDLGFRTFVLGASTKGNSLLQYYRIDSTLVEYALEVNEDKFGLRTVGSDIEIIPEDKGLEMKPDYLLCLPWHFRDFFTKGKFYDYMLNGGEIIFPLPTPRIVYVENGKVIWEEL